MKKLFTLYFLLSAGIVNAQWYQAQGPGASNITSIHGHGNSIYVATANNGLHISANGGASWRSANAGLPDWKLATVYTKGDTILASSTNSSRTYSSVDNGKTWTTLSSKMAFTKFISLKDTLYGLGSSIHRSVDMGKTWIDLSKPNSRKPYSIYKEGNIIVCGTDYGIFRSVNSGQTWLKSNKGIDTTVSLPLGTSMTMKDGVLYAGTTNGYSNGGKLYTSTDLGLTWTPVTAPFTKSPAAILFHDNKLFIASNGLYVSPDKGATWTKLLPENISEPDAFSGIYTNGTELYSFVDGNEQAYNRIPSKIYKSQDNGETWKSLTNNGIIQSTRNLVADGDTLYGSSGLVSYNNGTTWQYIKPALKEEYYNLTILGKKGNTIFGNAMNGNNGSGIVISTDNYKTWTASNTGLDPFSRIGRMLFVNDTIFVNNIYKSARGIYFSVNNGLNWVKATGTNLVSTPEDFSISGNYMYAAGGSNEGLFVSTNRGSSWKKIESTVFEPYENFNYVKALGDTVFAGSGTVYRSLDNGVTWTKLTGTANWPNNQGDIISIGWIGKKLYASFSLGKVFISEDKGTTWTEHASGLPATYNGNFYCSLVANKGRVFALMGSISQLDLEDPSIITTVDDKTLASDVNNSIQVFPNPTQGFVQVRLDGNTEKVLVSNSLGEKVLEIKADGLSILDLDLSKHSNGMYIVTCYSSKTLSSFKILKTE